MIGSTGAGNWRKMTNRALSFPEKRIYTQKSVPLMDIKGRGGKPTPEEA